jgi:ATP synthase protein I
MRRISQPYIRPIFVVESLVALTVWILLMLYGQFIMASSFVIGFICFFIPTFFFTLRVWRFTGAKFAKQVARSFYIAEAGKYSLTIVCFALSFKLAQPLNSALLFSTYVVYVMLHQIALFKLR